MIDRIFDWCVQILLVTAGWLGITYKEINVWVFVVIWSIVTVVLVITVIRQRLRIRQLSGEPGRR